MQPTSQRAWVFLVKATGRVVGAGCRRGLEIWNMTSLITGWLISGHIFYPFVQLATERMFQLSKVEMQHPVLLYKSFFILTSATLNM